MADRSTTKTGQILADVRKTPLFRQVVPMEAGISYPIPIRHRQGQGGQPAVYVRLPLFGYRPIPGQGSNLYPPFATLTLNWRTLRLVEYADLRFTRPWPISDDPQPVGRFPHEAIRASTAEFVTLQEQLYACYDELFESLLAQTPFADSDEFSELLRRLTDPGLEPFLRALGPRFYEQFLGPGLSAASTPVL